MTTTDPRILAQVRKASETAERVAKNLNAEREAQLASLDPTSLDQYRRMFLAACDELGRVAHALGIDPDEGGAAPILAAIDALKAKAAASIANQVLVGAPVEIGANVFLKLCMPVVRAASNQPQTTQRDMAQLYSGLLSALLGSMGADFGQQRAIEVAQLNVDAFSEADLTGGARTH